MWAQHTLPAGDPAWLLNAFFRTDGANNHAGFSSTDVDSLLDDLVITEDHQARVSATKRVHDAILAEVPVSNLVTPASHVGLSDRVIDDYEPWGSDYYVIRADTFLPDPPKPDIDTSGAKANSLLSLLLVLLATMTMSVRLL
jgi:peptide/nickel transport system substrate-binding protein